MSVYRYYFSFSPALSFIASREGVYGTGKIGAREKIEQTFIDDSGLPCTVVYFTGKATIMTRCARHLRDLNPQPSRVIRKLDLEGKKNGPIFITAMQEHLKRRISGFGDRAKVASVAGSVRDVEARVVRMMRRRSGRMRPISGLSRYWLRSSKREPLAKWTRPF